MLPRHAAITLFVFLVVAGPGHCAYIHFDTVIFFLPLALTHSLTP